MSKKGGKSMRKQKIIKKKNLTTPFIMMLFVTAILIFLNIQTLTYALNTEKYYAVSTTTTREKSDGFTMIIPMVEYTYQYQGQTYKDSKYFVIQPLFGLSNKSGTVLDIYVNKKVPDRTLLREPFERNLVNWGLLILWIFFIYIFIQRIIGNHKINKNRRLQAGNDTEGQDVSDTKPNSKEKKKEKEAKKEETTSGK